MDDLVFETLENRRSKTHQKAKMFYEELIVLEELQSRSTPNEGKIIDRNRCGRNHFEEREIDLRKNHPQNGDSKSTKNSTLL
jgi:hypothetical protein